MVWKYKFRIHRLLFISRGVSALRRCFPRFFLWFNVYQGVSKDVVQIDKTIFKLTFFQIVEKSRKNSIGSGVNMNKNV